MDDTSTSSSTSSSSTTDVDVDIEADTEEKQGEQYEEPPTEAPGEEVDELESGSGSEENEG